MTTKPNDLLTEAQFNRELRALGEKLDAEGAPLLKSLIGKAEAGDPLCLFGMWPQHLKEDVYRRLKIEPLPMFRRTK